MVFEQSGRRGFLRTLFLDDERNETDRHDHNELNMPERNRHADENTR